MSYFDDLVRLLHTFLLRFSHRTARGKTLANCKLNSSRKLAISGTEKYIYAYMQLWLNILRWSMMSCFLNLSLQRPLHLSPEEWEP